LERSFPGEFEFIFLPGLYQDIVLASEGVLEMQGNGFEPKDLVT
jgi:hypothetical protein